METPVHIKNIFWIRKKRFWAVVLPAQFFLFYLLSGWPAAVDFFNLLFEFKKYLQQFLFSQSIFSTGDYLYLFSGILLIYLLLCLMRKKKAGNSALYLLVCINIFYFMYQLSWGMLYFQPALIEKLPKDEINTKEAKVLSYKLLKLCKTYRRNLPENNRGVFHIADVTATERLVITAQSRLPAPFNNKEITAINAFKPSLFTGMMSFTGILGYYNPFTSEAQYNSALPSSSLPFTLAHESSHQLGYAREQEANFIGYLICDSSGKAELKYSANLFALKSLLNYILKDDPEFTAVMVKSFSPQMKRDAKVEQDFYLKHEGFLNTFFSITNNLFLKSNRQDGIISYSYFTEMLLKYERGKQ